MWREGGGVGAGGSGIGRKDVEVDVVQIAHNFNA